MPRRLALTGHRDVLRTGSAAHKMALLQALIVWIGHSAPPETSPGHALRWSRRTPYRSRTSVHPPGSPRARWVFSAATGGDSPTASLEIAEGAEPERHGERAAVAHRREKRAQGAATADLRFFSGY
jgi:hypothetical protein